MIAAKRRANIGATIVADNSVRYIRQQQQQYTNNYYYRQEQQQQQQRFHYDGEQQQQQQQQQQLQQRESNMQQLHLSSYQHNYYHHHHHHHQQQQQQQQQQQRRQQQQPQIITDHSYNENQNHYHRQQQRQHQQQQESHRQSHYYNQRNNTISTRISSTLSSLSATLTRTATTPSTATPTTSTTTNSRGNCSVKLPLDILWLPKSAMRPIGPDTSHTDCILVVGVSRPKLAVVFLTVMLISLFLTFHVLYDSAVYNIQAVQAIQQQQQQQQQQSQQPNKNFNRNNNHQSQKQLPKNQQQSPLALMSVLSNGLGFLNSNSILSEPISEDDKHKDSNKLLKYPLSSVSSMIDNISTNKQVKQPIAFPSNRVRFPKTNRRLPQALIIGIRKCGTRALLEMLYLHPRIQKAGGEVHFFDRDENYMKGLEWYRKKMPHSFRGQITIEKSPSYFVSPEVPERVRAMNASIKLLLIVREPVTRAISDYTQLRSHAATVAIPYQTDTPSSSFSSSSSSLSSSSSSSYAVWSSSQQQLQHQSQLQRSQYKKKASHSEFYNYNNNPLYIDQINGKQIHENNIMVDSVNNGRHRSDVAAFGIDVSVTLNVVANSIAQNIKRNLSSKSGTIYRQHEDAITKTPVTIAATATPTTTTTTTVTTAAINTTISATTQPLSRTFEELAIFPNGTVNDSYRPLTISMYHLHLHRWLEVFPREQLLIVNGDRLIDDPVSQLKRIETFLGIEHRINGHHFYFNETKGFYCLRYDNGDRCLRETKGRKHPHVNPMVISKLRKFFVEHNQRFYELIGEDLGWPEE